jgi:proteic killer suppression protein
LRAQLAAKNLFVRKQLALYQERREPRRANDAIRVALCGREFLALRLDGLHAKHVVCNMVIQSFADETSADLFRERNTRAARRIPRQLWRATQRKLKLLDATGRLDDLAIPAGNRLELLKGNQAGRHSIRVNEQYRVTFRWENGNAYEVRVEDYH